MARNRIKGITVEIGGDTTKLDKALAGTNKELAATQKSLKDVERLLKLDPGNTELLEQKQRLLAQAAEGQPRSWTPSGRPPRAPTRPSSGARRTRRNTSP
ncbi:MAG: hypothetical protein ACLT09_00450 [Flavonifractor plautii]